MSKVIKHKLSRVALHSAVACDVVTLLDAVIGERGGRGREGLQRGHRGGQLQHLLADHSGVCVEPKYLRQIIAFGW